MLYQKRKKAARDEMIRQQEESPGAWQKLRYKQQKSARNIGFALCLTFVFVPIIFVLIYVRAAPYYNEELPSQDNASSLDVLGDSYEYPDLNENPDFNEPEFPVIIDPVETPDSNEHDDSEEPVIQFSGTAYLTFDDGPHRTITPAILDILKEEGIKATFFMLPYTGNDDIFNRVLDEGHEIGNHSFSHDYDKLYGGSVGTFREDILRARRFVEDNYSYSSYSFRFPGGALNQSSSIRTPRIEVVRELGYRYFDWDIDPNDWRRGRTPEQVTSDVLGNTNGKEHVIILLHDTYERTLAALPDIISGLREQGYTFDILRNHP